METNLTTNNILLFSGIGCFIGALLWILTLCKQQLRAFVQLSYRHRVVTVPAMLVVVGMWLVVGSCGPLWTAEPPGPPDGFFVILGTLATLLIAAGIIDFRHTK